MKINRAWAFPTHETFKCKPIGEFVDKYISGISVDPFARNSKKAKLTNDINPETTANSHMPALEFLNKLYEDKVEADVILLDPPYSPRQITECYAKIGLNATMKDTQSSFWSDIRAKTRTISKPGTIVLTFGWNSCRIGDEYEIIEILLVSHGGAHNDTICTAQKMLGKQGGLYENNH